VEQLLGPAPVQVLHMCFTQDGVHVTGNKTRAAWKEGGKRGRVGAIRCGVCHRV
jgi:hypothetical protein